MLTSAGVAAGFKLTTMATIAPGNSGCCDGPFGLAVDSMGHIVVGTGAGPRYVFADADGQVPATALFTDLSFGTFTGAYAITGGVVYGATGAGPYVSFNLDGTVANPDAFPGLISRLGMWTNPINGHLIAQSAFGLTDIDPVTKSWRVIAAIGRDAVSVSPDGTTAYIRDKCLEPVDIATGAIGPCINASPAADGTVTILGGPFDGFIVASSNLGNVDLIDPFDNTFVTIATGGTRGQYVAFDPGDSSLLLDEADIVARLSCPGCASAPPPPVPEPATLTLFAALLAVRRKRH